VTRNQTKHTEGETEVHHRPKRGWVWNQFFVLEEHMGPDPQYVGKVSLFLFCFICLALACLVLSYLVLLWFGFLSAEKLWCEMKVELEYDLKRHEI
jgi:hypothetical protein